MKYNVTPCPKPRMTKRDRWAKRPAVIRYRQFCDDVRAAGVALYPCGIHVTFIVAMPKSWSKKKRTEYDGQPHQQRPDVDNFGKGILDAVYGEDCQVWDIRFTKLWGREGAIIVESIQGNAE